MSLSFMSARFWVQLAGLAQITLALGSLAVPRVLKWKTELAKTTVLIKQMFWVYAAYIFVINVCFGLVSFFRPELLLNYSVLAAMLTGFIALYWISRVLIQFFYLDRATFPKGKWPLWGEIGLMLVFLLCAVVYSLAFYHNIQIR